MDKVYKNITIQEAESLFDAGVVSVQFIVGRDNWKTWCSKGRVGDRHKYFSPLEMVFEYPDVRYRVEVE